MNKTNNFWLVERMCARAQDGEAEAIGNMLMMVCVCVRLCARVWDDTNGVLCFRFVRLLWYFSKYSLTGNWCIFWWKKTYSSIRKNGWDIWFITAHIFLFRINVQTHTHISEEIELRTIVCYWLVGHRQAMNDADFAIASNSNWNRRRDWTAHPFELKWVPLQYLLLSESGFSFKLCSWQRTFPIYVPLLDRKDIDNFHIPEFMITLLTFIIQILNNSLIGSEWRLGMSFQLSKLIFSVILQRVRHHYCILANGKRKKTLIFYGKPHFIRFVFVYLSMMKTHFHSYTAQIVDRRHSSRSHSMRSVHKA